MIKVYHYTTGEKLKKIVADGVLKVSEWEKKQKDKHPSLWFSTNEIWEQTATKAISFGGRIQYLTMHKQHKIFGCGRIAISYSKDHLINWEKYKHVSKLMNKC